jgi:hypothetical protein
MADTTTRSKFPDGSTTCDYDIFEELPDGTPIWRTCVLGMEKAELRLLEMARETSNKVFALNLRDPTLPVVRPVSTTRSEKPVGTARRMD